MAFRYGNDVNFLQPAPTSTTAQPSSLFTSLMGQSEAQVANDGKSWQNILNQVAENAKKQQVVTPDPAQQQATDQMNGQSVFQGMNGQAAGQPSLQANPANMQQFQGQQGPTSVFQPPSQEPGEYVASIFNNASASPQPITPSIPAGADGQYTPQQKFMDAGSITPQTDKPLLDSAQDTLQRLGVDPQMAAMVQNPQALMQTANAAGSGQIDVNMQNQINPLGTQVLKDNGFGDLLNAAQNGGMGLNSPQVQQQLQQLVSSKGINDTEVQNMIAQITGKFMNR